MEEWINKLRSDNIFHRMEIWWNNKMLIQHKKKGTKLNKYGKRKLKIWIAYNYPYGEFTVGAGMRGMWFSPKNPNAAIHIHDTISEILLREGFAEKIREQNNGTVYEFTERGRRLLRHGSIEKLLRQEINEERSKAVRYRREIYWLLIALFSALFLLVHPILQEYVLAKWHTWQIENRIK